MSILGDMWRVCESIRESGKYLDYTVKTHVFGTDTIAMFEDYGTHVIAVDGTNTFLEWVMNFCAWRIGENNTHIGYDLVARDFQEWILPQLRWKKLRFIGHSRGGAIALDLALRFAELGGYEVECITFGAPKVGGMSFVKACREVNLRHTAVIADRDPVPNLPRWFERYASKVIRLSHKERGIKKIHCGYGRYLND